jgi:hypothetical protein
MKFCRWKKHHLRSTNKPLSVPDLIKKAEAYDDKYLNVMVHAIELRDRDRREQLIQEFLSKKNRGAFKATNPHSKKLWLTELLQQFLALQRQQHGRSWREALGAGVACALVTLTHEDWACADNNIEFNLGKAKQMVRNALGGTNYIACFEAAIYKNEKWETGGVVGKLISFHCHAVAWSGNRTELDRLRSYIRPRFEPILGNSSGARFDALRAESDLAASITYMTKMPYLGKETVVDSKGKKKQRSSSKISYESREHLFNALKKYDLFQFWLSGGEGASVLRGARNRLKAKHKPVQIRTRGIPGSAAAAWRTPKHRHTLARRESTLVKTP